MKLHRIGVLVFSLLCLCAHAQASEPAGKDGWHKAGFGDDGDHRNRQGGGGDDHRNDGGGAGGGTQSHETDADATVQAIVDYCSRVDYGHRSQYADLGNLALGGQGSRGSDDNYQQAYQKVSASLQKVAFNTGVETCKAGIAGRIVK